MNYLAQGFSHFIVPDAQRVWWVQMLTQQGEAMPMLLFAARGLQGGYCPFLPTLNSLSLWTAVGKRAVTGVRGTKVQSLVPCH